jgi:hypothetical protein
MIPAIPQEAGEIVNCRIDAPEGHSPISLSFDDSPPSPAPAKHPELSAAAIAPKQPVLTSPKQQNLAPKQDAAEGTNTPHGSQGSENGAGTGTGATGTAPLHGKLTKSGSSIVYVLDRSGSMGRDRKLAHAVAMLKSSLKLLGPDVRFQIVTYDSQAIASRIAGSLDLISANPVSIAEAERQLDELVGEGSSRHFEGLRLGLSFHPDLLILITDADELSPKDAKALQKWNENKTTNIHVILLDETRVKQSSSLAELVGPRNIHLVAMPGQTPLH